MDRQTQAKLARTFAPLFLRAIRACRLYPAGSAIRHSNLDACRVALHELLAAAGTVTFGVREGELIFGDEIVLADDDVRTGPTHFLASHAVFELSFQQGLEDAELERLVLILAEDAAHRRRRGEDLVTLLWRHHFTHVRYRHVDVLAQAVAADAPHEQIRFEDEETTRLRGELAALVDRLGVDQSSGQDLIAMSDRALDTPQACQQAIAGNQQRIDWAIMAFAHRTSPRVMEALALELHASGAHDALVVRLAGAVLDSLARHPDPTSPEAGAAMLWPMVDDLLARGALGGVQVMVERARALDERPTRPQDRALAGLLRAHLTADGVLDRVVELLDRGTDPRDATRAASLLRAMGGHATEGLLARLDGVERPPAREVACALVMEVLSPDRVERVAEVVESARAESAAQLLRASAILFPRDQARLALAGAAHGQPAVRAIAVRMLGAFEGATPDACVVRALGDGDSHVRAVAARTVMQHRIESGARTIAAMLQRPGALEREPAELRALFHAHATLSGTAAVEDLGRLLGAAAALTGGHKGATIEAAAMALAATGSAVALEVLDRGARSLNPRLRGPCKAALASGARPSAAPSAVDDVLGAFAKELDARAARLPWPEDLGMELVQRRAGMRSAPLASVPPGPRGSVPPGPRSSAIPGATSGVGPLPSAPPVPRSSVAPPPRPGGIPGASSGVGHLPPAARTSGFHGPEARSPVMAAAPRGSSPPGPLRPSSPPGSGALRPSAPPPPARTPAPEPPRSTPPRGVPTGSGRPSIVPLPVGGGTAIDDPLRAFLRDDEGST